MECEEGEVRPNQLFALVITAASLLMMQSCASVEYSAEPIEAWVVDAETRQPIEGVIVVAHWELVGPMENYPVGQIEVLESVTDKNGRFHFPAWGPKLHLAPFSYLTDGDPELLFFKSGYKYIRVSNSLNLRPKKYYYDGMPGGTKEKPTGLKRISFWNGETIEMERFRGADIQVHYKNLLNFSNEVNSFATWHIDPCQWTNLPIAVNKMMQERKKLEAQGARFIMDRTLDQRLLEGEPHFVKKCGLTSQTFIEGMKK